MQRTSASALVWVMFWSGCWGGGSTPPPDPSEGAPEQGPGEAAGGEAGPSASSPAATVQPRRPELGRAALHGLVDREDEGTIVVATCDGERVLLLDEDLSPWSYDGELPAMGSFDVVRMALRTEEIVRGLDGAGRVQETLRMRPFRAEDCGLASASYHFPTPPDLGVQIAASDRRSVRFEATAPDAWDAPAPLSRQEEILRELASITQAYCSAELGIHRITWDVVDDADEPVGSWFLPCAITDRMKSRGGLSGQRSWDIALKDGTTRTITGPEIAPTTATRLLGFRKMAGMVRKRCLADGRCPRDLPAQAGE